MNTRRTIRLGQGFAEKGAPRPKAVCPRKPSDYPHIPRAHLDVAQRLSSPLLMGPPLCDQLIALVAHLFTEEEAGLVRHLGPLKSKSAADLARAEQRPLEQALPILERLASEKRIVMCWGTGETARYHLLPVFPGIFEVALMSHTPETLTPWHRRFVELFEALYETGFCLEYQRDSVPTLRFLPVGRAIEAHPMALPSDRLEAILDRYKLFAIGQCQCRSAMEVLGRGCGRPLGNCVVMGQWAEMNIERGWLKPVSRKNVLEVKAEAEFHGLATWVVNVQSMKGQVSCSCCGCCCHAMRVITEFNAPSVIAPPHFLPAVDLTRCTYCGNCAAHCPTGAILVDPEARTYHHQPQRCIGCGLCAVACDSQRAIRMEPVSQPDPPYKNWLSFLAHAAPKMAKTTWRAWRERR